jgi:hypothetical protein
MSLFTTSISAITRPGVYLTSKKPPAAIRASGTGRAALVCQTPFGPSGTLTNPTSDADRNLTFAPPGFNRTSTGILAMIQKGWPDLGIVRVLGTSAATASATLASSTPTNLITVPAKYPGADANSLTWTVSAASDGDSNHFNLTVAITGASGTTSETFKNGNVSGTGADYLWADVIANSRLIAQPTKLAAGIPAAGSGSFSSGANGTINAAAYVGTAGSGDKGIARLEGDPTIRHFTTDDCASGNRAAVNAGIRAHAELTGNRVGYMGGNTGQAASAAQSDAASYQSENVCYVDPWCYELDDVTGAQQLVQSSAFAMSVATQIPPSLRIAWRDPSVTKLLGGVVGVEFDRGEQAAANTAAGVTTLQKGKKGGFCFELDVVTIAPVDATRADLPRTRMGHYVGTALQDSLQTFVNGPNVSVTQQSIVTAITEFMEGLLKNKDDDPFSEPYVLAYLLGNIQASNTPTDVANGDFQVPLSFQTDTGMQKLIIGVQYGPTVSISVSADPSGA